MEFEDFRFQPVDDETARKLCLPPGKGLPLPPDVETALAAFPGPPLEFFVQCVEDYRDAHPEDHDYDALLFRHAYVRAMGFANEGDLEAARSLFTRALGISPDDVDCLAAAGGVALDLHDPAQAREWLRRARRAGGSSAELYDALARAEAGCGDYVEAVKVGEEALAKFPDRWETLDALTTIYFHAGRWGELEARLFDLLQRDPQSAATLRKMGVYFRTAGRFEDAHRCLDRALALQPDNLDLRLEVAKTLRDEGKGDDAEMIWGEVLLKEPDHAEALIQLGAHCLEQARPDEALGFLNRAAECAPRDFRPHYLLGKLHAIRGESGRADALAAFSRALAAGPADSEVLTYIAVMGRELGDPALATRAEKALSARRGEGLQAPSGRL